MQNQSNCVIIFDSVVLGKQHDGRDWAWTTELQIWSPTRRMTTTPVHDQVINYMKWKLTSIWMTGAIQPTNHFVEMSIRKTSNLDNQLDWKLQFSSVKWNLELL